MIQIKIIITIEKNLKKCDAVYPNKRIHMAYIFCDKYLNKLYINA